MTSERFGVKATLEETVEQLEVSLHTSISDREGDNGWSHRREKTIQNRRKGNRRANLRGCPPIFFLMCPREFFIPPRSHRHILAGLRESSPVLQSLFANRDRDVTVSKLRETPRAREATGRRFKAYRGCTCFGFGPTKGSDTCRSSPKSSRKPPIDELTRF